MIGMAQLANPIIPRRRTELKESDLDRPTHARDTPVGLPLHTLVGAFRAAKKLSAGQGNWPLVRVDL